MLSAFGSSVSHRFVLEQRNKEKVHPIDPGGQSHIIATYIR
jgi:hypothetical protein